jgi:hypothetical protein
MFHNKIGSVYYITTYKMKSLPLLRSLTSHKLDYVQHVLSTRVLDSGKYMVEIVRSDVNYIADNSSDQNAWRVHYINVYNDGSYTHEQGMYYGTYENVRAQFCNDLM